MSVRIDAAADYLSRSANLPVAATMSLCFWVYLVSDRNTSGTLAILTNGAGSQTQSIGVTSSGTILQLAINASQVGTGTDLTVATWHHLAYTRNGAAHNVYLNGVVDITVSNNNTLTTPALLAIGSNSVTWMDARLAAIKLWDAELTAAEVQVEMQMIRPSRMENLNLWTPNWPGATERLADYSGNGRNLTANGALTDEDNPPVSYGAPSWFDGFVTGGGGAPALRRYSLSLTGVG